jgi:hypothetical protein
MTLKWHAHSLERPSCGSFQRSPAHVLRDGPIVVWSQIGPLMELTIATGT